jgi:hypothetical protein
LHLFLFIRSWGSIVQGYPDFTVYYTAGKMLRLGLGRQFYDLQAQLAVQVHSVGAVAGRRGLLPFIHPPFEALLFLPLTYLQYSDAFLLWDLLNLAALLGVAASLRKSVKAIKPVSPWELVVLTLAFFPVFICLLQGQDSILLLLLISVGFAALNRNADYSAGCWFAFAMFKFQFVLPLLLLIGIWNRKKTLKSFLAVGALLTIVSAALVGWPTLMRYPKLALRVTNTPGLGGIPPGFPPNLRGLVFGEPFHLPQAIGTAAVLLISLGVFLFAAFKGIGEAGPARFQLRFSLAIIVSGLVAWQTNVHDLSLLVLPAALIWNYCKADAATGQTIRRELLLPLAPLLISPLWMVLWLRWGNVNLMTIPLLWWVWVIGKALSPKAGSTIIQQPASV